ncbi:MAG: CRISPR-associated protein [Cyanobacteria bacterium]|nr:CRISPR-associated protein [Cyanobacteriota bacterium]
MFKYLITVTPLGLMYGSAGAFLSPENLVGRSGAKFPPDAATLSGLFFSANYNSAEHNSQSRSESRDRLKQNLIVSGPFWAKQDEPDNFYVPIPRHRIIGKDARDEWRIKNHHWERRENDETKPEIKSDYHWQTIDSWNKPLKAVDVAENPWKYVSFLHPKLKADERCVVDEDGLFLENAVQLDDDCCLVYLSTERLPDGWYRLGGEGHMVEISSQEIQPKDSIHELLNQRIDRTFALITPGVWGSNALSYRYPRHSDFPREGMKLLTDKAIPYRYRANQKLGRGRYAVPAGSVYVLKKPIDRTWWEFPEEWFPKEGFSLKHLGCGLCLPVKIEGV